MDLTNYCSEICFPVFIQVRSKQCKQIQMLFSYSNPAGTISWPGVTLFQAKKLKPQLVIFTFLSAYELNEWYSVLSSKILRCWLADFSI